MTGLRCFVYPRVSELDTFPAILCVHCSKELEPGLRKIEAYDQKARQESQTMTTKHSPQPTAESGSSSGSAKRYFQQVPLPLTSLVGREHELQEALILLRNPQVRLLTITGPGGVGKSRLASQVAVDAQQSFADGYCFVELAHCTTPKEVELSIAQALGLRESEKSELRQYLQTFLRDKYLLFLLDNFEQVTKASPLLLEILSACPQLKMLVTSRAALHVQGEFEFIVPPLSVPDLQHLPSPEALVQYGAIALFAQRAQAISREFRVTEANAKDIAAICVRLDGLPLALELAAARTKLLPPHLLRPRLEEKLLDLLTRGGPDLPDRQQTLRNTLTWSYGLLTSEEQLVFQRLSVFVGGCTLEAAEVVCTVPGEVTLPVVDLVASLVDQSLLQRVKQESGEWRLLMLETIRAYALELLTASDELELTRHAHAGYYLRFAEQAAPILLDIRQSRWLERLEWEHDNLRATLEWLLACNETDAALRLSGALGWFWYLRGHPGEGRSLLERTLAASRQGDQAELRQVRASALYVAGWLAYGQLDLEQATMLLEEGLLLSRQVGDTRGAAAALDTLGMIESNYRGNAAAGDTLVEESLRLYREVGDVQGTATVLLTQGMLALFRGEFARAQQLYEESLAMFRASGDSWHIANVLHLLGWACYCQGAYAAARRLSEQSVVLFRSLGNPAFTAAALTMLASEVGALGEETMAASLLQEALALAKQGESSEDTARALLGLGHLALRQGQVAQACAHYGESLEELRDLWTSARLTARTKWIPACCLEGLGESALSQGQAAWAVRLFAAAETLRSSGAHRNPVGIEQHYYERTLAGARSQVGEEAYAALWAEGRAMTPEEALRAPGHLIGSEQVDPTAAGSLPLPAPSSRGLTAREREVLRLLAAGLRNQQIAERLVISPRTVNTHVVSIYKKLGVTTRAAALRYAIEHHLA